MKFFLKIEPWGLSCYRVHFLIQIVNKCLAAILYFPTGNSNQSRAAVNPESQTVSVNMIIILEIIIKTIIIIMIIMIKRIQKISYNLTKLLHYLTNTYTIITFYILWTD